MSIGIKHTDKNGEVRILTGLVNKSSIPMPSGSMVRINKSTPWNRQLDNFLNINEALKRNGKRLTQISMSTYVGSADYITRWGNPSAKANLTSFVATSTDALVWYKYEGGTAGGGQNWVYVGGKKMKLTWFLDLSNKEQDKLIQAAA